MSVVRRKTASQLGGLRGTVSPPQWGARGEALENFGYLAFCGAQNIVFVAVCDDKQ